METVHFARERTPQLFTHKSKQLTLVRERVGDWELTDRGLDGTTVFQHNQL